MLEKLKRSEFWFALIAAVIPVLNKELGLNLDTATIALAVSSLLAYVVSRGIAKMGQKK